MGIISAIPLNLMRLTSTPDSTNLSSLSIQPLSLLVRILVSALVGIALLSGGVLAHLIVAISHNVDDPTTLYVKIVTVTQGGTVLIEK